MTARYETYQKVMTALQELADEGAAITVKAVAKRVGVARATLYNDAELLNLVQSFEMQQHFESGYAKGHRAGQRSSATSRHGASEEWARGILYIAPGEALTASVLKRRRAALVFLPPG